MAHRQSAVLDAAARIRRRSQPEERVVGRRRSACSRSTHARAGGAADRARRGRRHLRGGASRHVRPRAPAGRARSVAGARARRRRQDRAALRALGGDRRYLIERGADIDARDVDHESTPAQYLVREAPDVTRFLVERGAWFDIFIAVGLARRRARRAVPARRSGSARPSHLARQVHGRSTRRRPATREEIGDHRGDIYRWVFGHNLSALDAAPSLGYDDIARIAAGPRHAGAAASGGCAPGRSRRPLRPSPRHIRISSPRLTARPDAADRRAPTPTTRPPSPDARSRLRRPRPRPRPVRGAAVGGVSRQRGHDPAAAAAQSADQRRPTRYGGTPLGNCLYGALHGWSCESSPATSGHRAAVDRRRRASAASLPANWSRRCGCCAPRRPGARGVMVRDSFRDRHDRHGL